MSLVSAGRINQDTPPLTTLSRTSKSSAMDTSSHTFEIMIRRGDPRRFRPESDLRLVRYEAKRPTCIHVKHARVDIVTFRRGF